MKKVIKYIAIASIPLLALFASLKLKATTSLPTGSCAALMSLKSPNDISYGIEYTYSGGSWSSSNSGSIDAMILINFTESKIYINKTNVQLGYTFDAMVKSAYSLAFTTETMAPVALSIGDGPLPGSYLITAPANTIPDLILMPVNSGNTFLIQAKNSKATGVCQKV